MSVYACYVCFSYCCFFFKQKTAYEMRISYWSSDVCSSDLICEAILKYAPGYAQAQLDDADFVRAELKKLGADVAGPVLSRAGLGALQLALFEETAEARIGRASCRERVCQYVCISVVAESLKQKQ